MNSTLCISKIKYSAYMHMKQSGINLLTTGMNAHGISQISYKPTKYSINSNQHDKCYKIILYKAYKSYEIIERILNFGIQNAIKRFLSP